MDDPDLSLKNRLIDRMYDFIYYFKIGILIIITIGLVLLVGYLINSYLHQVCPEGFCSLGTSLKNFKSNLYFKSKLN